MIPGFQFEYLQFFSKITNVNEDNVIFNTLFWSIFSEAYLGLGVQYVSVWYTDVTQIYY